MVDKVVTIREKITHFNVFEKLEVEVSSVGSVMFKCPDLTVSFKQDETFISSGDGSSEIAVCDDVYSPGADARLHMSKGVSPFAALVLVLWRTTLIGYYGMIVSMESKRKAKIVEGTVEVSSEVATLFASLSHVWSASLSWLMKYGADRASVNFARNCYTMDSVAPWLVEVNLVSPQYTSEITLILANRVFSAFHHAFSMGIFARQLYLDKRIFIPSFFMDIESKKGLTGTLKDTLIIWRCLEVLSVKAQWAKAIVQIPMLAARYRYTYEAAINFCYAKIPHELAIRNIIHSDQIAKCTNEINILIALLEHTTKKSAEMMVKMIEENTTYRPDKILAKKAIAQVKKLKPGDTMGEIHRILTTLEMLITDS